MQEHGKARAYKGMPLTARGAAGFLRGHTRNEMARTGRPTDFSRPMRAAK